MIEIWLKVQYLFREIQTPCKIDFIGQRCCSKDITNTPLLCWCFKFKLGLEEGSVQVNLFFNIGRLGIMIVTFQDLKSMQLSKLPEFLYNTNVD